MKTAITQRNIGSMKIETPNVVIPKNPKCRKILTAFAVGCSGKKFKNVQDAGPNLGVYGVKYGQDKCLSHADHFWYIDNGYFGRSNPVGSFNGYYRISHNALFGKKMIDKPWDRFNSHNIKLRPPSPRGKNIVLVPPSKFMAPVLKLHSWTEDVTNKLREYTDRPIMVSTKANPMVWKNIWCVVCCMSNVQTEALIKGFPVITTHFTNMGSIDQIENPTIHRQILADLAYQQWTLKEIESGKAWRELNQ